MEFKRVWFDSTCPYFSTLHMEVPQCPLKSCLQACMVSQRLEDGFSVCPHLISWYVYKANTFLFNVQHCDLQFLH